MILGRDAPVVKTWVGPAFALQGIEGTSQGAVRVNDANADCLRSQLHEWIPDVPQCQPMVAFMIDDRAVSLCCSVRRTDGAHEAGVETASAARGQGHASIVVAAWARAVREEGLVPLYSTSWENEASRSVARKLGLLPFGSDLHIT
jgi:hypothetical protein